MQQADKLIRLCSCDLTSTSNIRVLTDTLNQALPKINFLVLSPGMLSMSGRDESEDGIDKKLMLHYYSRMMIANLLIPRVQAAADAGEEARIMSVLDAKRGAPSKLDYEDLDLKRGYSLNAAANHGMTMTDILFSVR